MVNELSVAPATVAGVTLVGERSSAQVDGVSLDDSQVRVLAVPDGVSAAVLGAPGSGKTTTLIELVAHRVLQSGWNPSRVIVLGATRTRATNLRDRLALRL